MSKALEVFTQKATSLTNVASKFTPAVREGQRLLPSRNKDADFQCRIDAGHFDPATKRLNVVLQINSQATSPALVNWARKNSTHGKLATESFDTAAPNKNTELKRVLLSLQEQAKTKVG